MRALDERPRRGSSCSLLALSTAPWPYYERAKCEEGRRVMRYSEGSLGRVFVLQLEEGDPLNATVQDFAGEHDIRRAVAFYVGGGAGGTGLVVGPDKRRTDKIVPVVQTLGFPHETLAVGTLFPDDTGRPVLHMHAACGCEDGVIVGCTRAGLETWLTGEIVLVEIVGTQATRKRDPSTGFQLLDVPEEPRLSQQT
jgi:uncharacterized protein